MHIGSHINPLYLAPLQYSWFADGNQIVDGRTAVDPRLVPGESTCVLLVNGQSNAGQWGTGYYTPTNSTKVQNLNIYNGAIYLAVEPLLGTNGPGAGFTIRLADSLITAGTYERVILVPIAVGGASAAELAPGGPLNHRIGAAKKRMDAIGLTATFVLRHQGETDNSSGTSQAAYAASLQGEIDTYRALGIDCPILIAKASWSSGTVSTAVQNAQMAAVNNPLGIYAGPDTDTLGAPYRSDAAHFNATGLAAHAALWLPLVQALA